ncbi:tetratricopeptide repeat protein [Helicobacter brantae]|uniref:ATP-dependent nuclease n=1 Tax=Helicobacter brantae TaxID=375927 RepID=A0A3D8IVY6_9HELI|nr:tetratricopeptide repeat protein [Helicobacter brantae]RDU69382.1 ATP-dependent nuclease [Helicobacter brantae]
MKKVLCLLFCFLTLWGFNEDDMVNEALNAVDTKEYAKARDLYLVLYEESHKLEYFREAILVSSLLNDPQGTINLVLSYQKKSKEYDLEIEKVLADSYLRLGDVPNSIAIVESIQKKESTPLVHEILGSLYLQSNRVDDALAQFNEAYKGDHSERSLEQIIAIYSNSQNNERIGELLNSHLEKYGCSQELCKRSIEFYVKTKQISRVEKLLKEIEEKSPTIQNATNLIAVYAYEKKYDEAIEVAKKYPLNRSILLELYLGKGDFSLASNQAKLIYEESKNYEMLILSQIYFFETIKDNPNKDTILSIIKKLQYAISELKKQKQTPQSFGEYLNFLGYLMIDYDVDIKKGMEYVKEALALSPENVEFIDSLAWGYYKLGDCNQAKREFDKIPKAKIQEHNDLKTHQKALLECKTK